MYGDLLLAHRNDTYAKFIDFGQRRLKDHSEYDWPTHAGIEVHPDPHTGQRRVVEALWPRVACTPLSAYDGVPHAIVDVGATAEQRELVVAFADHCVGREYGVAEAVSLGRYCVTGSRWRSAIDNQLICSALAAEALCRTAAIFSEEPLWCMPIHLSRHYKVRDPRAASH